MKHHTIVETELINFIRQKKRETDIGMDKHLYDHLLWMIEDRGVKLVDKIGKLKCYNRNCREFISCYGADRKFIPGDREKLIRCGDVFDLINYPKRKEVK